MTPALRIESNGHWYDTLVYTHGHIRPLLQRFSLKLRHDALPVFETREVVAKVTEEEPRRASDPEWVLEMPGTGWPRIELLHHGESVDLGLVTELTFTVSVDGLTRLAVKRNERSGVGQPDPSGSGVMAYPLKLGENGLPVEIEEVLFESEVEDPA